MFFFMWELRKGQSHKGCLVNELVEQVQQVKKFRVVNQPAASRLFNEPETRPHRKQHEDEDETGCKPGLDDWRCAGHLLGHIDGNLASMLLLLKYKLQTHSTIKKYAKSSTRNKFAVQT